MLIVGTLPLSSALIEVTVDLKYNRNGNLIQDANYYYEYNSYNLLSRIRDHDASGRILAEYWYGGNHERLIKTVYHEDGSNTTTYYIGDFVRVVNPDGSVEDTDYFRDMDGNLLARQDSDGKKYFYHPDALGSTALVTDEAGDVVEEVEYLPFGEVIEGGNDRYLFTGKEKDKETKLSYYGARYYDPNQARFIQPDSIQPNVYDPQQLNKYAYARNNPVKYTDENGNVVTLPLALVGVGVGALVGGGFSLGVQLYKGEGVNWRDVGRSAAVGGVSGGIAGATAGGSLLLELGGGVAAGRAAQLTDNALSGESLSKDILNPGDITFDVATAGLARGAGKYIGSSKSSLIGTINPNEAKSAGFKELNYHFSKHYKEFGFTTKDEYVQSARSFLMKNDRSVEQYVRKSGEIVRYEKGANRFIVYNPSMNRIETYFRPGKDPQSGYKYYLNDKQSHLGGP